MVNFRSPIQRRIIGIGLLLLLGFIAKSNAPIQKVGPSDDEYVNQFVSGILSQINSGEIQKVRTNLLSGQAYR